MARLFNLRTGSTKGKPQQKMMLLPLPEAKARVLSLENHLSLVAMRSGYACVDHLACLLRALYLAFFIQEARKDRTCLDLFLAADAVLAGCLARGEQKQPLTTSEQDNLVLGQILTLHDEQLASVSSGVFVFAQERLVEFVESGEDTPIKATMQIAMHATA